MIDKDLDRWFSDNVSALEKEYIRREEPWRQSGFSGPEERWVACRRPIADCVDSSGSFLDIGCANGYLLECVTKWKQEEGISIIPHGLDVGMELVKLAKLRLPQFADNLYIGNAFTWEPAIKFDYVRTEVVYVPKERRTEFITRLLDEFVNPGGRLLVCEYRSSKADCKEPWIDEFLRASGFNIMDCRSGYFEGNELTRVVTLG